MPRLRQKNNDCVVIVFCEITGEDEDRARVRFMPYLTGEAGISLAALAACLTEVGWKLTAYDDTMRQVVLPDGAISDEFDRFWRQFQGQAVIFYNRDGAKIGHTILVRSGGIVIDPHPLAPEEGEFIFDHFKRVGRRIEIKSVSTVTRMRAGL